MGRVLLVDDDGSVLEAMRRVLVASGYEVTPASGGDQALDLASQREFDAAVVDLKMPAPDGLDVLRRLVTLQPRCMRILASGALDLPKTVEAVNLGWICKVVAKPFTPGGLLEAVQGCLAARSRMEHEIDESRRSAARDRHRLLAECLSGDLLQLAVQPIVRRDGAVVAHEALLRSAHPVLSGPAEVLAAAEACDAIDRLADVVVDRAGRWLDRLPEHTKLFLNLHPHELRHPHALGARLDRLAGRAHRVVLEITERSSLSEIDGWENAVRAITRRGFAIAIDDLGAGYSSLAILADLRPAYIKADMSIVRGCHTDPHRQRILSLLGQFAETDGATLIAEGIETAGEAATACRVGAHWLQGYWLGRPRLAEPEVTAVPARPASAPSANVGIAQRADQ